MATITFNEVAIHGMKSVKCAGGCGRTLKRSRKFWQTLSPFNKKASGELKSRDEIYEELTAERKAWIAESETCKHCG
jgi:predicted unusual protein kinase regulating ubiquinone biosynthesis (AarF/ABC1/UbiB family)